MMIQFTLFGILVYATFSQVCLHDTTGMSQALRKHLTWRCCDAEGRLMNWVTPAAKQEDTVQMCVDAALCPSLDATSGIHGREVLGQGNSKIRLAAHLAAPGIS